MCGAEEHLEFVKGEEWKTLPMGTRVQAAIASLEAEGRIPSFYQVAERAAVARSTLYRNKTLRVCIEEARERFSMQTAAPAPALGRNGVSRQSRSLRAEIEMLRKDLAAVQGERDALERRLAMQYIRARHPAFVYGVCHVSGAA